MLFDDVAKGDGLSRHQSGIRGPSTAYPLGMRAMEHVLTWKSTRAMEFLRAIMTYALCGPGRTEMIAALNRLNHGMENDIATFFDMYWMGLLDTHEYNGNQIWRGPHFIDFALQAGLPETTVPRASQPIAGTATISGGKRRAIPAWKNTTSWPLLQLVTSGGVTYQSLQANNLNHSPASSPLFWAVSTALVGRGDTNDDNLQAFTGNIATWLPDDMTPRDAARKHIKKCWVGKAQNCEGSLDTQPFNVADPLGDLWNAGVSYTTGQSAYWSNLFYVAARNTANERPDLSPTAWTLVGGPLTTRHVPPGWNYFAAVIGDTVDTGDIQDHWHMELLRFDSTIDGPNPRDGNGVIGNQYGYDYDWDISAVSAVGQIQPDFTFLTTVTVTIANAAGFGYTKNANFVPEALKVGDEIAITGTNFSALNVTNGAVSAVLSATQFQYQVPTAIFGLVTITNGVAFPRKYFCEQVHLADMKKFMATLKPTDAAHMYYCPRMAHAESPGNAANWNGVTMPPPCEEELRYLNTINANDAMMYLGTPGAASPADSDAQTGATRNTYRRREEMIASADDVWFEIANTLDATRGVNGWNGIVTTDNGWQQKAHKATEGTGVDSYIGAKGYLWRESLDAFLWISCPKDKNYVAGGTCNIPVALHDVPLTILSFNEHWDTGLLKHHAHDLRDGYSISRLLQAKPTDPILSRALLGMGKYFDNTLPSKTFGGQSVMTLVGGVWWKLMRRYDGLTNPATLQTYILDNGVEIDPNTVASGFTPGLVTNNQTTGTFAAGTLDAMTTYLAGRADAVMNGRCGDSGNTYRSA